MQVYVPVNIPVCYWTKTSSSSISYETDEGLTGTISGYSFIDIKAHLGRDYIFSYVPAEVWT
jgi:hypothetical protein